MGFQKSGQPPKNNNNNNNFSTKDFFLNLIQTTFGAGLKYDCNQIFTDASLPG